MKHLSRLDIEAIAEKYITAYMELPEVQDMPVYRIEPELFLERVLGLKIDYAHLSYDGTLLGMTSFVEVMVDVMTAEFEEEHILLDGSTVLVESDLRDDNKRKGRRNFKFNIREQDPQKYSAVKAEQDKLSAICGVQMKIARICPYCGHTVSIVYKGDHSYTQEKCSKCGETVTFPPISFRLSK